MAIPTHYHPQTFHHKTTLDPVSTTENFYQEQQSGGLCSVHAINALAGQVLAYPSAIAQEQNKVLMQTLGLTIGGSGPKGQWLAKDVNKGVDPATVMSYLENTMPTEKFKIVEGKTADILQRSDVTHPTFDRGIVAISGGNAHFIAVRKDAEQQWRVIDSMTNSHIKMDTQPRFDLLAEAVQHAAKSHNALTDRISFIHN